MALERASPIRPELLFEQAGLFVEPDNFCS
jgi:hypothetical protein